MFSSAVKSTCRKYVTKLSSLGLSSASTSSSSCSSLSKTTQKWWYHGCRHTPARSFASSVPRRNDVPETGLGEDGLMPQERIRNIAIIAHGMCFHFAPSLTTVSLSFFLSPFPPVCLRTSPAFLVEEPVPCCTSWKDGMYDLHVSSTVPEGSTMCTSIYAA